MSTDVNGFAYAGYCQTCGAMNGVVADLPDEPKFAAKHVAEMLRSGLRVERVTDDAVRKAGLAFCDCARPAKRSSKNPKSRKVSR